MSECNVNDVKKLIIVDPNEAIDIVGGSNIKVLKSQVGSKTVYQINYQDFKPATIQVNTSVVEVGTTVPSFEFLAQFIKGSEDILTRTMVPDKGLDLAGQFSWTESNILGTEAGLWPRYDGIPTKLSCVDTTGNEVTKLVGVEYRLMHYVGYSPNETLTENQVKALINKDLLINVKDKYLSFTYGNTSVPEYIYWAFPLNSVGFSTAKEGPLPVPLKLDLPNVQVTVNGITNTYRVIRTAEKTKITNALITLD